ncbi:TetR family transcriptional regulator [Streptomyces cinnamoneus]|uniref:TetR family transcriptional regulator n=1 Tax=Streptomyces cinnamoneus TaxID=53446 RepID=A0A2G1XH54_STRCJ|nr:TetR/AcrR family transcriptional regulator C-terminal domain-containing protein [Streptomyces cinnamoneus]PHQ50574.1 TetR family transcriptional regulator [Streptomyces cinnamoneus]PPT14172.1 TetR family transcriptional regulator [Streptomyces cinnamoneus]
MASGVRADSSRVSVWLDGGTTPKRKAAAEGEAGEGALDRERIVAATVRLLDAEGLAKFSMRRLAAELGVTAMSVYWYVANKDDLLEYALDHVCAGIALPDAADESTDWREQLRVLAAGYRRQLLRHPWVPQLLGRYLNIGPNAMEFSNAVIGVMRRTGLPDESMAGALSALFQFVYGFTSSEVLYNENCRRSGVSQDDHYRQTLKTIEERPDFTEKYRDAMKLAESRFSMSVADMFERDFSVAVDTVIAGIEAMRDRGR